MPRVVPLGLVGAPLLFAANIATLFVYNEESSAITMLATLPIAAWELSVGTWMFVKGLKPSPSPRTSPRSHDGPTPSPQGTQHHR